MNDKHTASLPGHRSVFRSRRTAPTEALIWSRDLTGRCARVTAIGSDRLLVENHTGLLELTECRVKLNSGCGSITVSGQGLSLCEARRGALIIEGMIQRIDLPCKGGDGA